MSAHLTLTIALAFILLFLSSIESAFDALSELQLRVLASEHAASPRGRLLQEMVGARQRFRFGLGFGIQFVIVLQTITLSLLFTGLIIPHPLLWSLGAMLIVVVLLRQLLPQLITQNRPEQALLVLLPAYAIVYRLLLPLSAPITRILGKWKREEPAESTTLAEDTGEEIQAFIDVGEEEGIIQEGEAELIQSIVELGDKRVNEVMTPRSAIVAVPATTSLRAAIGLVADSPFTRVPVYRGDLDNIEGVIHLRDLLRGWKAGRENVPVTEVMRPAYFVPETKAAAELLEEMKHSPSHIALVIDEYGGLAGLVTIEDLLAEVVGGIQDEDDLREDRIEPQPDGSYLVPGDTEIRRLELLFSREIAADDFSTVAGLVMTKLSHLPVPGETVEFVGLRFEVKHADGRRIQSVVVRHLADAGADSSRSTREE